MGIMVQDAYEKQTMAMELDMLNHANHKQKQGKFIKQLQRIQQWKFYEFVVGKGKKHRHQQSTNT